MRSAPALGMPRSATTAVVLAAFLLCGLNPRPMVFAERRELVWG
jgi:putative tricarboxylic transport membrane protein